MKKKQMLAVVLAVMLAATACGKDDDGGRQRVHSDKTDVSVETVESADTEHAVSQSTDDFGSNTPLIARDQLPYTGTEYVHGDFSIVLPDSWDGKYTIEENDYNDGFTVYQTASKEEDGSGILFSMYKSDKPEFLNEGAILAYTPDAVYNIVFPSDVNCAYDNQDISNEYFDMCKDIDAITYSLNVAADNVNYKTSEYKLPGSEYFDMDETVLEELTYNDLLIAKEEIYARHGKIFHDNNSDYEVGAWFLQAYFDGMTWYEAKSTDISDNDLSDIEKDNLDNIEAVLESKAKYLPECISIADSQALNYDVDGDGTEEEILYYSDEAQNGHDLTFYPVISIDGDEYQVWDYEQFGVYMDDCADHCYLVKLDTYDATTYFFAVLDYGPSDDEVTHLFRCIDGSLEYVDTLPGFFISPDSYLSGLDEYGCITGICRVDTPDTSEIYQTYSYDAGNNLFDAFDGEHEYKCPRGHELLDDLEVALTEDFTTDTDEYTYTFKKGQTIYFESIIYADVQYLKVKNEEGVHGYISVGKNDDYQDVDLNTGKALIDTVADLYFFD